MRKIGILSFVCLLYMMSDLQWEKFVVPSLYYVEEDEEVVRTERQVEDTLTYEMLLALQAKDEERLSEDLEKAEVVLNEQIPASTPVSLEKLQDFNYLLSTYYTVDSTTSIGPEQLNASQMMSRDMKLQNSLEGPKVLIFHTHSQEAFRDSIPGDTNTSIVGMG